ncbi:unnamed protein product [Amoebophrya sp. A25]|nr:unnamed protein product [Amoebophrya sp. A25]|eukprot:GSA25T00023802001.1
MTHAECERDYKIGSGSSGHTWDIGKCRDGHSFQGKDCVAKYIGPGQYTTKTLATEVMLQHLLWTYFHTKKSNMPNCIPFVDQVIIEGAFGGAIIVMEKLAAAEPVQLYAAGGSDPLEHAERAFECLKILNNEIFVTHGDFKAANVGLATQGSDEGALRLIDFGLSTAWKVQNYPAAGSGFEVVLGAARDRKWQTEPQTVGRRGTPLLMHPHLNRIPSCFQVGTGVGAALPPTVGLHIDLYALAMALVSQRFGGLLSIEVRRVFGASLGYAFIEREQAKGEGLSSDDLDFLEPYLPCYGVESDARPPVRSQEYCSWQANFQQLAAEAYNEVAMGRASDAELARVRPVCYRGFRQHTIQRYLFNIFVDRVDPLDERLSVLVSRCLVFSATMNTKVEGLPLSQDGLAYVVAASYNTARGADVELQVVSTKSGSEVKVWLRSKVKDIRMSTIHHDIGYEYLVDHYGQATEASLVASYSGQATAGIGVLGPDPVWVPEARVRAASPLFLHGQTVIRYVYGQRFPNTDLDMDMDMDVAQAQHATVASSMWRPTIGQVCYMISFPSIDGPGREQEQHEVVEQNENGLLLFELGTSVWLWDASVGRLTEWRIESFQQHYPRRVISYKVVNELQQQERKDVETHLLRRLPLS